MSPLSDRNRALLASRGRGGLTLGRDDVRRVQAARQRPSYAQPPKQAAPESGPADAILSKMWKANGGQPESMKPQEDDDGLASKFFGTTVGKGLGVVLNNPIVKSALKPLDVLGVPQRAIASTINEVGDLVSGEGFSAKDWIDQTNPDAFWDGNHEGSIGMGDVWQKHGKALGAGDNQWLDAAVGFLGDVATDPLTYVGGIGLVDKGLDGLRTGSRFARIADDAVGAAAASAKVASKPSGRSLAGRGTRAGRWAEARGLFERADGAFAHLPDELKASALREIDNIGEKGLSFQSKAMKADPALNELVRDALNVSDDAGLRFRAGIPFTAKRVQGQVGATRRPAQAVSNAMGELRGRRNTSSGGQKFIGYTSPIDYEGSVLAGVGGKGAKGDVATAADKSAAASNIRSIELERGAAGRILIPGQAALNRTRGALRREIRKAGGDAEYMALVEGGDTTTVFNKLMKYFGEDLPGELGVSVPLRTNYAPHVPSQRFLEFLGSNAAAEAKIAAREGGSVNLLKESALMQRRAILPDMDITMPDGNIWNTGDATITQMNQKFAEAFPEFKGGRIFEDRPIKLLEDYVEALSEDVGRRSARADMVARGEPGFKYNVEGGSDGLGAAGRDGDGASQAMRPRVEQKPADWDTAKDGVWNDGLGSAQRRVVESVKEQQYAAARARRTGAKPAPEADMEATILAMDESELRKAVDTAFGDQGANDVNNRIEAWGEATDGGNVLMDQRIIDMRTNLDREIRKAGITGRAARTLTNFFKTYATLTPGFHVRNGISAMYMNGADGVPFATTAEGLMEWRKIQLATKGGKGRVGKLQLDEVDDVIGAFDAYFDKLSPDVQDAFTAVVGSGAGGRFTESGFAQADGKFSGMMRRLSSGMTENPLTRASQKVGANVEGSVRMGVALDTIRNGGTVQEAIERITRIHFDYSQTSRLDQSAKAFFPFWSFMSRNLPLQVMQQWSRPAAYSTADHFMENFTDRSGEIEGLDGEIPDYIKAAGGGAVNLGPFNWFEPDLPHTRLHEQVQDLAEFGTNPGALMSGLNPILTAPVEWAAGKDLYTGQQFDSTDLKKLNTKNPLDLAVAGMAAAMGGYNNPDGSGLQTGEGGWYIPEGLYNSLAAVNPLQSRGDRLFGSDAQRRPEGFGRMLGAPVRTITQKQIDNQAKSKEFDEADRLRIERIINGNA